MRVCLSVSCFFLDHLLSDGILMVVVPQWGMLLPQGSQRSSAPFTEAPLYADIIAISQIECTNGRRARSSQAPCCSTKFTSIMPLCQPYHPSVVTHDHSKVARYRTHDGNYPRLSHPTTSIYPAFALSMYPTLEDGKLCAALGRLSFSLTYMFTSCETPLSHLFWQPSATLF